MAQFVLAPKELPCCNLRLIEKKENLFGRGMERPRTGHWSKSHPLEICITMIWPKIFGRNQKGCSSTPVQQTSKKFATELAEKINSSPKSLIKLFRFQKGCDFETAIRHQEEEVDICISLSPSPAALSWRQPPGSIASDVLVCSPVYKCSSVLVVPLVYKCTSVLHSRGWTVAVKQSYTGYFLDWHLRAPE